MNLTSNPENFYLLEQVLEQTDVVFFMYDLGDQRFRYLSPVFEDIWERSRKEYYEAPEKLLASIHPEDLPDLEQLWQQPQHQRKNSQEFRILDPAGEVKWLRIKLVSVLTEAKQLALAGFVEDISKAKDHDFTLQKYSAKKNSALEILSHDLAAPLNIIRQLTTFLLQETQPYNNPEVSKDLQLIQDTCARSVNLIRELVNQEFLESVNAEIVKDRHDLVLKMQIVVENYQQSEHVLSKKFNLAFTSEPIFVEIDEVKFMQVINNLISNAIKFTGENGIINILVTEKEDEVEIIIEDNGVGIPEKYHAVLFDRFTPARRPGLRGEHPVGLGMSIIKRIVDMHQGRIWFKSKVNEGSEFHVVLPKQQQEMEKSKAVPGN